jgi:uncharacterized protein
MVSRGPVFGRHAISTWKDAVMALARQRATTESLDLWGQSPAESPRFNYRWEHLLAVERLCRDLGSQLGADSDVLAACVWLHDIVKTHSTDQGPVADAALASDEARRFLLTTDFPPSKVDAVYRAILVHEGLYKDERLGQLDAAILWDADKLSKLGATYLVHTLCSRPAFDPIFQGRPTDTALVVESLRRWLEIGEKIARSMNTDPGKAEAVRRLAFLREFAEELEAEWLGKIS